MNPSLQILLCIAVIILVAKLMGALTGRIGLPVVLGELLAGILLGPTLLDIWSLPWFTHATSPEGTSAAAVFKVLAEIGVVLLMFFAGLETDVGMMKNTVAPAFWAATGGVVLPMFGGAFLARKFGFNWQEAIFIGTILTATSVTITAQTLMNLNQLRSKVGSTILGAAVIDDVLGLIVLSVVVALAPQIASSNGTSWRDISITLGKMVICLITMFWLGPPLTRWVLKVTPRLHGHHTEAAGALVVAFALAFEAQWLGGMAAITGAYLAGLFFAFTAEHQKIAQDLQPMINALFAPIFFVSIGLDINARQLSGATVFFVLLLAIAIGGKIVGCGLGALGNRFTARESMIVGVGMIPRGEVGLITAAIGLTAGIVTRDVYTQAVILVLITTLITPPLLRFAFPTEKEKVMAPALEDLPANANGLADA
jgi:Kef-type K+ transport system membrane component KefB